MKAKEFIINGATIYALQDGDSVVFYMSIKTCRCFHCATLKAKIEDITEEDAKNIWNLYYQKKKKQDDTWRAKLNKYSRCRRPRWKKSDYDDSELVIRVIERKKTKKKQYVQI